MMTLKEQAYQIIRELIIQGDLKAGDFLTERFLVEKLQMSRTPIRSALDRLEVDGLIKQSPKQGILVLELSLKKAIEIYDLRMAIESHIVKRLATSQFSDQQLAWFKQNLERQHTYMKSGDTVLFAKEDSLFHNRLATLYENQEMLQIMAQIQDKLYQIALKVLAKEAIRAEVSYGDHVRIFNLMTTGKGDEAAQEIIQHLEYGKQILIS